MLVFLPLIIAAVLLFALFRFLVTREPNNAAYKWAVGLSLMAALLLFWVNGAVGIIGDANNDANMLFFAVLGVGFAGALIARFEARGMARALFATAALQVDVAVIALVAMPGTSGPIWPWDLLSVTVFFGALWFVSALLFQKAATRSPMI